MNPPLSKNFGTAKYLHKLFDSLGEKVLDVETRRCIYTLCNLSHHRFAEYPGCGYRG